MTDNGIARAVDWVHDNEQVCLSQFIEFLRIPCVSADPAYHLDLQRCAGWLLAELRRIGFQQVQVLNGGGAPVVYGEWLEAGPDRPTVLVYAHYDGQPVDPLEKWESPPFEPAVRDGKLYARGALDDKGGTMIQLKAWEAMLQAEGRLPVNVQVLFEGEEESGSPTIEALVQQQRALLQADLLLLCDGSTPTSQPKICYGLRGIAGAEVVVRGSRRDLHSGLYGGIIHNPVHLVGKMIASLHDQAGRVQIPGFYDAVRPVSGEERERLAHDEATARDEVTAISGREELWGDESDPWYVRAAALPTCDVNGVWGGYQGAGAKTVIPAQAGFKVSLRLVPDQDPQQIVQQLVDHLNSFRCRTLEIDILLGPGAWPATMESQGPAVAALQRAYQATRGQQAWFYRTGGSVPIAGFLQRSIGLPILDFGIGVGDNIHAPNEYMQLLYFAGCIETAIHFYHYLVE